MNHRFWLPIAAVCASVAAEDDPFGEAFDSGFSEVETQAPVSTDILYVANRLIQRGQWATAHDAPLSGETDHRGLASLATAWNTRLEWRPSEQLNFLLNAELSHDWVFDVNPDAHWQTPYRDQRETRLELDEARLGYTTPGWALTSGRQVLTWGFNDVLSILEPVNPPQRSQPGLYDADEARLSRWLSEARWYLGRWTLQGAIAHENRMAELPVYGSDYYPLPAATDDRLPDHGWEDPQAHAGGVRISGLWHRADLAAFIWRGYNPSGHPKFRPGGIERHYERLTTFGAGFSLPVGPAIVKAEMAAQDGLAWAPVTGNPPQTQGPMQTTERLAWALGADLTLPANSRLVLEVSTGYLPGYQPGMAATLGEEYSHRWAIGLEHSTAREQLTFTAAILGFGLDADGGQAFRLGADWTISDQWRSELGWVGYHAGNAPALQAADNSDRLFWQVEWLF
ncbi:hypothetical protein [Saccharospirillum impatiens]|uniref:hypothetical protein n=1 Tax=Saccharospirillum impatiens TaxID=169438 RepID=UPI00040C1755|nr:hypothetical protein [Saccharospirillum impatiens]